MACEHFDITTPNGHRMRGFVCSRGARPRRKRCTVCGDLCELLCDGPASSTDPSSESCDAPICPAHALHVEPNRDYCPAHRHMPVRCPHCGHEGEVRRDVADGRKASCRECGARSRFEGGALRVETEAETLAG